MELRQLRVFLTVAEEQSFTRAAGRLFLAQSAVSSTVRSLEHELRVSLFDRRAHPIELTEAGRVFCEHALATITAAERAVGAAQEATGVMAGTVRFGVMQTRLIGTVSVASIVAAFMAEHPLVTITAEHLSGTPRLTAAVRDGSLDLAIVSSPSKPAVGVELIPLETVPIVLVCHRSHPLGGSPHVRLPDLAAETFVDLPSTWGTSLLVDQAYAELDVERDVRYRVNDLNVLIDFVANDLAVALLPRSHVPPDQDLVVVPVEEAPILTVQLALPTNRVLGAAPRAFGAAIREQFHTDRR